MLGALIAIALVAIQIYAIFDVAKSPQESVRNLPKWGWLVIVIFFGLLGSIAWFVGARTARPNGVQRIRPGSGKIIPPDDNDEFLKKI
jgi:hypothetical protein